MQEKIVENLIDKSCVTCIHLDDENFPCHKCNSNLSKYQDQPDMFEEVKDDKKK